MERFYWVVEERLAGCSVPGGVGRDQRALERDLTQLVDAGVGALLTLTEAPLAPEALERAPLVTLHLPVPDLYPPSPGELLQALHFIDCQHVEGRAVAVHCKMGQGRTGTVLAAYRIRGGLDADAALEEIRRICPGAIGSDPQIHALRRFAATRPWIV